MARLDTIKTKRAMIDALEKVLNNIDYQVNDIKDTINRNNEALAGDDLSDYMRGCYTDTNEEYERQIKAFDTITKTLEKLI